VLARLLSLVALSFALALPALAAPAPFRRAAEPDHPPVKMSGWLRRNPLTGGPSWAIGRETDWQTVAKAWGIKDPPKVDFRTHFLFLVAWNPDDAYQVHCEIDRRGDLRANLIRSEIELGGLRQVGMPYLIRSYRRCEVETVNGLPLPR